jgi:uncharacterized HAD superfamily protein
MKIAVDVDEVLVPLAKHFFTYHNKKFGTNVNPDTMAHYRYNDHLGVSFHETISIVHEYYKTDDFRNMPCFEDARKALAVLSRTAGLSPGRVLEHAQKSPAISDISKKHELIVISSRYGEARGFTKEWINREFPGVFSDVVFSAETHYDKEYIEKHHLKEKAFVCCELNVDLMIEDSLYHSLECAKRGVKVFLLDKPWNQGSLAENVTRVKSWNEILEKIKALEI